MKQLDRLKQIPRRKALFGLAATVLAATVVMGREKPAVEVVESTRTERRAEPAVDLDLSRLDRSTVAVAAQDGDPFANRNFNARPAQQAVQHAAPQAPAAPDAPPLPFRYVGHLVQDGKTHVFLANGDEAITAQVGQKLAGEQWRLDKLSEQEVELTYLPLKKKQTLPL